MAQQTQTASLCVPAGFDPGKGQAWVLGQVTDNLMGGVQLTITQPPTADNPEFMAELTVQKSTKWIPKTEIRAKIEQTAAPPNPKNPRQPCMPAIKVYPFASVDAVAADEADASLYTRVTGYFFQDESKAANHRVLISVFPPASEAARCTVADLLGGRNACDPDDDILPPGEEQVIP